MKNVTITLKEEVAQWARVLAARHNTSVSRLLGEMLETRMREEQDFEHARRRYLSRKPVALKRSGKYPSREEIHDRPMLR
jgi:hypothetical protein